MNKPLNELLEQRMDQRRDERQDQRDGGWLTEVEASQRLARDGRNELPTKARPSLSLDLLRRVSEPLNLTLVIVGALTAVVLDERVQGSTIIALAIVNTLVGGILERRADDAAAELGRMLTRRARVIRDGAVHDIAASDLVVGDVVVLTAGDQVPADLELTETVELRVDESALTGESLPVEKAAGAENSRSAFSGTLVVAGTGQGLVTATGPRTRIGAIAAMLSIKPTPTPLQRQLGNLTGRLGALAVIVGVVAASVTYWRTAGESNRVSEAVLVGIALALAAVPEGLPTAVTAALAFSGVRLARHGAIVRSLTALEALGTTTVLCTDKTGTLTEGKLEVLETVGDREAVWLAARRCNDATRTSDEVDLALLRAAPQREADEIDNVGELRFIVPFDPSASNDDHNSPPLRRHRSDYGERRTGEHSSAMQRITTAVLSGVRSQSVDGSGSPSVGLGRSGEHAFRGRA